MSGRAIFEPRPFRRSKTLALFSSPTRRICAGCYMETKGSLEPIGNSEILHCVTAIIAFLLDKKCVDILAAPKIGSHAIHYGQDSKHFTDDKKGSVPLEERDTIVRSALTQQASHNSCSNLGAPARSIIIHYANSECLVLPRATPNPEALLASSRNCPTTWAMLHPNVGIVRFGSWSRYKN